MKDELLGDVAKVENPTQKLNLMREYLQAVALRSLHESEAFKNLAFVGGTALRFIHSLARFSEDLDFSLENAQGYDPESWLKRLKRELSLSGFEASVSWNNRTTVHKSWVKVSGLMYEAGISPLRDQNISIRLEIDTRPPLGSMVEKSLVNRHRLLALRHYDLPSLMAGKMHALLTRRYPKGRDWYDFIWYRTKHPPIQPNLILLQNALNQSLEPKAVDANLWREMLADSIEKLDIQAIVDDVSPFLERPEEKHLLTQEYLLGVVRGNPGDSSRD